MCHGSKVKNGKTIGYKTSKPKHANAQPYLRSKHKAVGFAAIGLVSGIYTAQDFLNYDENL